MKFDTRTTAVAFLVLYAILACGTLMSPMSTTTVATVSVGLLAFGVLAPVRRTTRRVSRPLTRMTVQLRSRSPKWFGQLKRLPGRYLDGLITGATTGIGTQAAVDLVNRGWWVFVYGRKP